MVLKEGNIKQKSIGLDWNIIFFLLCFYFLHYYFPRANSIIGILANMQD